MPNLTAPASPENQAYSDPSQTRWLWLKPYRWWLALIAVLCIVTAILSVLLVTKTITIPSFTDQPQTTAPTPTPTPNAAQQAFFAKLSPSLLYYAFSQTSSSKIVYQTDTTDTRRRIVTVGYPGSYSFLASPNGHWLLRYNDRQIEIASPDQPEKFTTLYTYNDAQMRLTSAIWQADSQRLAIVLTKNIANPLSLDASITNQIVLITPDSNGQPVSRQVLRQDKSFRYSLIGLTAEQKLWYVQDRNGLRTNLTKMNLDTAVDEYTFSAFNADDKLGSMQFTSTLDYAYINTGTAILQYDLSNQHTKTIHQLDLTCPNNLTNQSVISSLSVSPNASQILIAVNVQPCPSQSTSRTTQPIPASQHLQVINTRTQEVVTDQTSSSLSHFNQAYWSPNGQHVWLAVDATTNYELDLAPWSLRPIPNQDRTTINKEKVYFLGWLDGK